MTPAITAQQMRDIERAAIESGAVTGLALMERAGQGVVAAIGETWPALSQPEEGPPLQAIVLCGPGNNGGDGFAIARLLLQLGWRVRVLAKGWDMLWSDTYVRPDAPPDARANMQRWHQVGGRSAALDTDFGMDLCVPGIIVVIDAVLGIGQNRDTDPLLRRWWAAWDLRCNVSPDNTVHCVSVDVPTGYDTDSGRMLGTAPFEPDLVVTFHASKPVHRVLAAQGIPCIVKDIGL